MEIPVRADEVTITGDGTDAHPLTGLITGLPVGAPDKSVQFNDAGAFGGDATFTYDKTTQRLVFSSVLPGSGAAIAAFGAGSFVSLQAGTTQAMTVDLGLLAADTIEIINSEPASGGILIEDNVRGVQIHGNDPSFGGVGITGSVVQIGSTDNTGGIVLNVAPGGTAGIQICLAPTDLLGFFGVPVVPQPVVAGAKLPGDVVMASLLAALVALGLVSDTTT